MNFSNSLKIFVSCGRSDPMLNLLEIDSTTLTDWATSWSLYATFTSCPVIPVDYIEKCKACQIHYTNALIEELNMYQHVSEKFKPPDHTIVSLQIEITGEVSFV